MRLGPYELGDLIGAGGMAQVYVAREADARVPKTVAIKLIRPEYAAHPGIRRKFELEADLAKQLDNPNIVMVIGYGEHEGHPYQVLEWVDCLSLGQLMHELRRRGQTLSPELAAYILAEATRALRFAHTVYHLGTQLKVRHCDVSPQNILIGTDGEVKLTDFGVARLADAESTAGTGHTVRGKVAYMPPEQYHGLTSAAVVDLYPLGAILQEMVTGRLRAPGAKTAADVQHLWEVEEPPPLDVLPPDLDALRRRLLRRNPAERPQTADEVLEALESWPGYRHGRSALGKIIRKIKGVPAPRSGPVAAADAPEVPEALTLPPLRPDPGAPTPADAGGATEPDFEEDKTTFWEPKAAAAAVAETPASTGRRWGAVAAVVAVLGLGGGAVAFGTWGEPEEAPVVRAEAVEREVKPEPEPAPAPVVDPSPPEPPLAEAPAPEPEQTAEGPTEAPEQEKPPRAKKAKPVPVRWVLRHGRSAIVKVAGKRVSLEPTAEGTLPPGRHTLRWQFPGEPWRRARIKLKPGQSYKIALRETTVDVELW